MSRARALPLTCAALGLALASAAWARTPMVYDGPNGPITTRELDAFAAAAAEVPPAKDNVGNPWVYGKPGQAIEGIGLVYEATGDRRLLDQMIRLSDAALAARNDLAPAPVGQRVLWTGTVAPAWPNSPADSPAAKYSSTENGDVIGHIAYCAYLILRHPELHAKYRERARQYVSRMDESCLHFLLPALVRHSDHNRFYYPSVSGYRALAMAPRNNAGNPVPWNQQFMIDNGLERLAQCHEALRDNAQLTAMYDSLVRSSLAWFLANVTSHRDRVTSGNYYLWDYALADTHHVEDSNHCDIDLEGLQRCFGAGRYADTLKASDMRAFANDNADIMALGRGRWAGHVDGSSDRGHGAGTNYPRPNFLFSAVYRPDAYPAYVAAATAGGRAFGDINTMSRLLWLKWQRSKLVGHG